MAAASLPSGARGRALALAISALLLASLWLGIAAPLIGWYGQRTEALDRRAALARRMGELAQTLPALQKQAQASAASAPPASSVLDGASDAIAGAALQGLLEAMAGEAGARLSSTETLPAEQVGAFRRIGLRVTVDAKWPVLVGLLRAVEQATPRMFVDDLQLRGSPLALRTRVLPLNAGFTVLAFRAGATAAAAPGKPGRPASRLASP